MVKKKLTKKKLKQLLADACICHSQAGFLALFLDCHYKEIQQQLGVAPRTMRRYRSQLKDAIKERQELEERRESGSDLLKTKNEDLTLYKYSITSKFRELELVVLDLKSKRNGLYIVCVLLMALCGSMVVLWPE